MPDGIGPSSLVHRRRRHLVLEVRKAASCAGRASLTNKVSTAALNCINKGAGIARDGR